MTDELRENSTQNVDENINNDAIGVPVVNFKVHHWTEIKSSTYSVDYEMIFSKADVPFERYTGMVRNLSCCLNESKTALGEKASSRLVHFDKNYLKFQLCTLLRDLLFECDSDDVFSEDETDNQFYVIRALFCEALEDYRKAHSACLDDLRTYKAVKPKVVTQYLKEVMYKP